MATTLQMITDFYNKKFETITRTINQYEEGLITGPEAMSFITEASVSSVEVNQAVEMSEKASEAVRQAIKPTNFPPE